MQSSVSYSYHPGHLSLATETITIAPDGSGPLPSLTRTLSRSRDNLRRPTGFVLGNEHAVGYGYDVSGRLATFSAQGLPNLPGKTHAFEYTYEPGSSLLDKVTGPVHEVENTYEPHRDVLLQKTNTRTVGIPGELSVIGYTVNAIGQREQRNLSGEIRADFYGGQTADLYTTNWGHHALGQVVVHYEYDPFGNLTRVTGSDSTRFFYRFSTKPRDPATGRYDYGFRWFDPYAGGWPSRDPIEESGGVNLYGFVGNDGASKFDLYGLQSLPAENEDPNPLRPNPVERPAGMDKLPPGGQLVERPKVVASGNCLGFALRDFHKVENWDQSTWENALTHVPKGCRKVSCDGVDAGHTRCKDGECDMIVFLALSKAATPEFHAIGRKVGTQFGWSSTIFHYTNRTSGKKEVKGLTPIHNIINPQAHVEEYYPNLLNKERKREKFCFCCKCRDDKDK